MVTTNSTDAAAFLDSVLRLTPKIAVFDCDGTLWSGDAGESFFRWELQRRLVSDEVSKRIKARHDEYLAGNVSEDAMCGEMVTLHAGLAEADVRRAAKEFFEANFVTRIFPEMRCLIAQLHETGCEVWAVSSTNNWVIETGMEHFDISPNRILAAAVEIDNGVISNRLIRVPSGPGKPKAIREVIQRDPDAVFGNSRWDADMLEMAQHPFVINPNPDLEQKSSSLGWPIYWPDGTKSGKKS
ncbi:MAG: haloacid dehalogenase-like hydrolase [Terriglobales bacterium]|jgi:phosphoserine phosphatase